MSSDGSSSDRGAVHVASNGHDADAETRRALCAPVHLTAAEWECTLPRGEYLIGRDPTCRVFIDDPLASREHARLAVSTDTVTIADQGSANGVFVNNVRISERRCLFDGDRVLIGATEIRLSSGAQPAVRSAPPDQRPTLSELRDGRGPVATVRAEAVEVLGRVADRMLAAGQPEKAKTVLVEQLVRILNGARSGLTLPTGLCQLASRYALKLAAALHDGRWIDYVMELHLLSKHAMAPATLADLASALAAVRYVDQELFRHYADWLGQAAPRLAGHAGEVARRLSRVELPPAHPPRDGTGE